MEVLIINIQKTKTHFINSAMIWGQSIIERNLLWQTIVSKDSRNDSSHHICAFDLCDLTLLWINRWHLYLFLTYLSVQRIWWKHLISQIIKGIQLFSLALRLGTLFLGDWSHSSVKKPRPYGVVRVTLVSIPRWQSQLWFQTTVRTGTRCVNETAWDDASPATTWHHLHESLLRDHH